METVLVDNDLKCFHCGQPCEAETFWVHEKSFCCYGCKAVYEILESNNLCEYYSLDDAAGNSLKKSTDETYDYLNDADVRKKLLTFDSKTFAKVTFFITGIHCISCIWLLENLRKINPAISRSEVNFAKKSITIDFNPEEIQPGSLAQLIASLGYVPKISLDSTSSNQNKQDNSLALKLGIAGFCFGNVMLFSFPEYLGIERSNESLMRIFSWLNLGLSIPVFIYSAQDYLKAAFRSFKQKEINIDLPIAAGLIALFFRSTYDIVTATGAGYLDSFTGLVFFLLIGRWFQGKTYESLSFDRDFTAYFPLAVNRLQEGECKPVIIYNLVPGDQLRVRNMELIPADSTLESDVAYIDYSFVTGEAKPEKVLRGSTVYAGGRLIGAPVELLVRKPTSQSHLTSLWNNEAFKKVHESKYQKIIDRAARKFTWIVLGIAFVTALWWYATSPQEMWLVITCVLMVACPCALALAAPFTLGSMLRVLGRHKFYLKNADVIERMATIDTIVFDKTGTVTHGGNPDVTTLGDFSRADLAAIRVLTSFSTHPLSAIIAKHIHLKDHAEVIGFKEIPGKGIEGTVNGSTFRIGSAVFVGVSQNPDTSVSEVFVSIDGAVRGSFAIRSSTRENISKMFRRLGSRCHSLLSGDHDGDRAAMQKIFRPGVHMLFNQSPQDKLNYIRDLQSKGRSVMMVGDGLNDAGALKQSDVGIAITDDSGVFTPASDGILFGNKLEALDQMLRFARTSSFILKAGFAVSFFYNAIALGFAVSGNLTPLVAAIIMPLSSISVVGFSTIAVRLAALKNNL